MSLPGHECGPVLGLTLSRGQTGESRYETRLHACGARTHVLSHEGGDGASPDLAGLDGLLLSGGGDVHPRYYGQALSSLSGEVDTERDEFEIAAVLQAVERGLPVFGICRGAQVLNVALGGTLHQDIGAELGAGVRRHKFGREHPDRFHPVHVAEGSWLRARAGADRLLVNSHHHQAVRDLASGLRAFVEECRDPCGPGAERRGTELGIVFGSPSLRATAQEG